MDPLALGLVLAAAIIHAGWNRLLHDTPDRPATLAVAGLAGGVILLPATLLSPPVHVLLLVGLSGLAEAAYALCLAAAYRRGALSLAYPIARGTAPLLVTLGGWLVLSQRPTVQTVGAATALVIGLVLVATADHRGPRGAAVGFALLTGVAIATYSLIDARAVQHAAPAAYLGVALGLEGILLTLWVRGSPTRLRPALQPGIAIAFGTVGAYLLVLFAFQRAGAGRVATLREISVLIGVLLAREKSGWRVWAGAALVVTGAVLAAA